MLDCIAMLNFGQLTRSVQQNCDISDAQFAGHYSLCTFLLKMRELYRWEHEIPLTAPLAKDKVGAWLSEREQMWDALAEHRFEKLRLTEHEFEPFETAAINTELAPHGYVYSGGYGLFHKPQFFLGELVRTEYHDSATFHVTNCEYARELSASPAMLLGNTVFIRQESLRRLLWEKIEEWHWKKNADAPLALALACYPDAVDLEHTLERMTDNETHTLILHERGELAAGRLLGPAWEELLAAIKRPKAEFLARAVRDHLADSLVTLPTLAVQGNAAALHFYFANFSGLRREIFPAAKQHYQRWCNHTQANIWSDWCDASAQHWNAVAQTLLDDFARDPQGLDARIEALFPDEKIASVSCSR